MAGALQNGGLDDQLSLEKVRNSGRAKTLLEGNLLLLQMLAVGKAEVDGVVDDLGNILVWKMS